MTPFTLHPLISADTEPMRMSHIEPNQLIRDLHPLGFGPKFFSIELTPLELVHSVCSQFCSKQIAFKLKIRSFACKNNFSRLSPCEKYF